MTLTEFIAQIQQNAELIRPNNAYVQAVLIAVTFIVLGKIADWIISGIIGRFARQSSNEFDDQIIDLVHRPIFVSFVLLGLSLSTSRIGLPESTTFITTRKFGQTRKFSIRKGSKTTPSNLAPMGLK